MKEPHLKALVAGIGPKFENLVDGYCFLEDFVAKEEPELSAPVAVADTGENFDDSRLVAWAGPKFDYLVTDNHFLEEFAVKVEPELKAVTAEKSKEIEDNHLLEDILVIVKFVVAGNYDKKNSDQNSPHENCLLDKHPLL